MPCTDPDTLEYVRLTGHVKFLEQMDPASPLYDPRYGPIIRAVLARLTKRSRRPQTIRPRTRGTLAMELVNTVGVICRSCTSSCGVAYCFAGRGDANGQVRMSDCIACVEGRREPGGTITTFQNRRPDRA